MLSPIAMETLALTLALAGSGAHDWPAFGGPTADLVSPETDWSSQGAAEPLWTRDVGHGYACSSIVEGRLYTSGQRMDTEEDVVVCLDALTGEERWSFAYPMPLGHDHGIGTLSTPTVAGEHVYVASRNGVVRCFDRLGGELRWTTELREAYGLDPGLYGFSASPVVHGDELLMCMGRVFTLRRSDGAVTWSTADDWHAMYSTPVLMPLDGQPCAAVFTQDALRILDLDRHELRASFAWDRGATRVNAASPLLIDGRVFVSSAYGQGCVLLEWQDGELVPVFQNRVMRNKTVGSVRHGGYVYGFDEAILKCMDLEGQERWRVRGLGSGCLTVAGDRLLVLTADGELIVARASADAFEELSRRAVLPAEPAWSVPVLCNGLIYARASSGTLVCLDHRPGVAARPIADASVGVEVPADLPAAADLFRAHLAALGGEAALRGHDSMTLQGTFELVSNGSEPIPWRLHLMAPDRWCWETLLPKPARGWARRVFDGEAGWEAQPRKPPTLLTAARVNELKDTARLHADAEFALLYPEARTIGVEDFRGARCHVVEATTRRGTLRRLYFEVESGLLRGRTAAAEAEVILEDYRDFEGIMIATRVREYDTDTGDEFRYEVQKAAFDRVDAAMFERDGAVEQLLREEGRE